MLEQRGGDRGESGRLFSFRFLVLIVLLSAAIPIALVGWKSLYVGFLETSDPHIELLEVPRGIGRAPVKLQVKLSDAESGLDEVVVRTYQRHSRRTILKEKLGGRKEVEITIDFPGEKSSLEEGSANIEIRVFDKSFWNNRNEKVIPMAVDYRKPELEVYSTQHNAVHGGSQLIFYRAFDEALAVSGVRVGGDAFFGYPAKRIDEAFTDDSVYVAIYTVPLRQRNLEKLKIQLFAEDLVGNATSKRFHNTIRKRIQREVKQPLSDEFLRTGVSLLADTNLSRLQGLAREAGSDIKWKTPKGSKDRLIEKFRLVNERLRAVNNAELEGKLRENSRHERFWYDSFIQSGVVQRSYGDKVKYTYGKQQVGSGIREGYRLIPRNGAREVVAANDGIVMFTDNLGVYGQVVAIDHGLGLVSVYGSLASTSVNKGESVNAGQTIGEIGKSGIADKLGFYFEIRVSGIPVDPREWWDRSWFLSHVSRKIDAVKKQLGIPIYQPF